ncbi:unnamed protein product [Anisakis simplex]|uniref:Matrix protein n=1 Tax=Anisakis simplex TaxID=6269 RepID=A0A0M3JRE3_ANISI|nr:unnamed protein product [Anisakis simplex]
MYGELRKNILTGNITQLSVDLTTTLHLINLWQRPSKDKTSHIFGSLKYRSTGNNMTFKAAMRGPIELVLKATAWTSPLGDQDFLF